MLGHELTILTTNIRGLRQGCGELRAMHMAVERGRPHFLCLTETRLDAEPDISPTGYTVKGRSHQARWRSHHHGARRHLV